SDPCFGRYIYVHDLPPAFNEDMLKDCEALNPWTKMCDFIANAGLGPPLEDDSGPVFSNTTGWYATHQFALDLIFFERMKRYECLTGDSSLASAVFVPFFAGFDVARFLWGGHGVSERDAASLALVDWLGKRTEWRAMDGRDHFLVAGRITWDFRRLSDRESDWGNKLLLLPEARNMIALVVESSPWSSNDHAIPYPTYFHPSSDAEIVTWQNLVRKQNRSRLFCFAGAPRPGDPRSSRDRIIGQCRKSKKCELLECGAGESECYSPVSIMNLFRSSVFCLQPQGDSYTRRSAFDSMLAGCIPVFFHPGSAYVQYTWHLPRDHSAYSVFIPEDDDDDGSIERILDVISAETAREMREVIVNLIPRIVYGDSRGGAGKRSEKDAFDIAVEGVIKKVSRLKEKKHDGDDDMSLEPHEWDPFFSQ
ncbi:hypothetical protein M569_05136, partial [Genlisea aurea]